MNATIKSRGVSLGKAQELLLKIAKQQREIQCLKTQLAGEKSIVKSLFETIDRMRAHAGCPSDDTVPEVLERLKRNRELSNTQAQPRRAED